MTGKIACLSLLLAFSWCAKAQSPILNWSQAYGGSYEDGAYDIKQTSDGGFIISGYAYSTDGDVVDKNGPTWYSDGWIVKVDASGDTLWTKTLGGNDNEHAFSIIESSKGGYVVALFSRSNDGDVSTNYGAEDVWVVRLNSSGDIVWENSYGGTGYDRGFYVAEAIGGYVITGYTASSDGDVNFNNGGDDVWLIKVDEQGNLLWEQTYGGSSTDRAYTVELTPDSGFILCGYTWSSNGDVAFNNGDADVWVFKTDSLGNLEWEKTLGGTSWDYGNMAVPLTGGGYAIAALTYSNDGDVTFNNGYSDAWLVKLDDSGNIVEWEHSYGGSSYDAIYTVRQTYDGGFIAGGHTRSADGDVTVNYGVEDAWILKLDSAGILQWQESLGGDSLDRCYSVIQNTDGSYNFAGVSLSFDWDVPQNKGKDDLWFGNIKCVPPFTPEICMVTVDSTSTQNVVVWEKPSLQSIAGFNIYREITGTYTLIDYVPFDSLSHFSDNTPGVNPNITSYRYKIASVDTCGNVSALGNYHKTIHLNITMDVNQKPILNWTDYIGFGFTYYRILRDSMGQGDWQVLDSTSAGVTSYTDITAPETTGLNYLVEVIPPGSCTATKAIDYNSTRSNSSEVSFGSPAPIADFYADSETIEAGSPVNFFDLSSNDPTSWNWSFPGGSPSSQTIQDPYNIIYSDPGCYEVSLEVSNVYGTDTEVKTCYINVGNVGVNEKAVINPIRIYPNPAQERIWLTFEKDMPNVTIQLFDIAGKELTRHSLNQQHNAYELDIAGFPAGIYHLKIYSDETIFNRKIIIR